MQCPNCGSEVRGKFCTNCGTRLADTAEQPAGDPSDATSVVRPEQLRDLASRGAAQPAVPASDPTATARISPEEMMRQASHPEPPSSPAYPASAMPRQDTSGNAAWAGGPSAAQGPVSVPSGTSPSLNLPTVIAVPPGVQNALAPFEAVNKQYLAWAGALLLIIGLFVSAKTYSFNAGIAGVSGLSTSFSLWSYGTFWAVILLLLALASAGLAFIRDYKWLLITGGLSLLILILNFLYAFSSAPAVVATTAHPSWGWILLFPGVLLILAAGATRTTARDAADDNGLNNLIGNLRSR